MNHYPFLDPFDRLPPEQREQLRELAADPTFDPSDYHRGLGLFHNFPRCRICRVDCAPAGVCGYCRGRVRTLRMEAT